MRSVQAHAQPGEVDARTKPFVVEPDERRRLAGRHARRLAAVLLPFVGDPRRVEAIVDAVLDEACSAGAAPPTDRDRVDAWLLALARRCLRSARRAGLLVADRVYGHLASGLLSEGYLLSLIPRLRAAVCEIYAHPGTSELARDAELSALLSPKVREAARLGGMQLTTYSNLAYRDAGCGGSD